MGAACAQSQYQVDYKSCKYYRTRKSLGDQNNFNLWHCFVNRIIHNMLNVNGVNRGNRHKLGQDIVQITCRAQDPSKLFK